MATGTRDRDEIARRMAGVAEAAGDPEGGNPDLPRDPWQPRWHIDERWVTFECGCVAERVSKLYGAQPADPVIFPGMAQQAVYAECCDRHRPGMNVRIGMGFPGLTFEQWKRGRRALLTGRVRP